MWLVYSVRWPQLPEAAVFPEAKPQPNSKQKQQQQSKSAAGTASGLGKGHMIAAGNDGKRPPQIEKRVGGLMLLHK